MLRSVGGDELNVTVAAARLMQDGDLAPQVVHCCRNAVTSEQTETDRGSQRQR
jgi:hypothetical protein